MSVFGRGGERPGSKDYADFDIACIFDRVNRTLRCKHSFTGLKGHRANAVKRDLPFPLQDVEALFAVGVGVTDDSAADRNRCRAHDQMGRLNASWRNQDVNFTAAILDRRYVFGTGYESSELLSSRGHSVIAVIKD